MEVCMIADKIKLLREASHLTQTELAKNLNITRSSVNAWEMGISVPSTTYLIELALLFHVSPDFLLGLEQNNTIDISTLNTLGPKKFFAETFKTLFRNLSENSVMQKLLLYEMTTINSTTKRSAETRDVMNLNLITFYENLFAPAKINIKSIASILIGGIYYLILHKECAKICTIDYKTKEGENAFSEGIDFLTDIIFDRLEMYDRDKKAIRQMISDGISESKICKYMGINKNDLKTLLSE